MDVNSSDVYVMHHGKSYKLSEVMDMVQFHDTLVHDGAGGVAVAHMEALARDLESVDSRLRALEQALGGPVLVEINLSRLGK